MRLTHTFDGIGVRFQTRDYQIFHPEVLSDVIPVVIELRDGVLAPPVVQVAARQAQLEALGLDQDQDQPQPPPPHSPLADHVIDDEIPPPPSPPPSHPPQYPPHVYADLPPAAQAVARDFDRRLLRSKRYQIWIIETLMELRAHAGLPPHPLPPSPPPEDQ
ncbi:hypothetical protein Hanom_Chr08g00718311 [Helianthus anomalus]